MSQQERIHWQFPDTVAGFSPQVGLVLGSGLGSLVDQLEIVATVPFSEVPELPVSRVPGHAGRFVFGTIGKTRVVVAQGRVHLYEGWSAAEVSAGVCAMASLGIDRLILTNAAGIVQDSLDFVPGRWMQISDHLNMMGESPLAGSPAFIDMSEVYAYDLRKNFAKAAETIGIDLVEGVYAGLRGPQYETPAEVRMLRTLGADAVGMSTVPEAIQARALGLEVAGFSCLTNYGAGLSNRPLNHEEVIEVGSTAAGQLVSLLTEALG